VITKDLKKLGYDASPRKDLPFAGMGGASSAISTGFDPQKESRSPATNPEHETETGLTSGLQIL
jgi:hypothetical protein